MKKVNRKGVRRNTGRTHFKKGFTPWNKGKSITPELSKKFSDMRKGKQIGKDNPFYGKKHTPETKLKMTIAQLGRQDNRKEKHHSWKGGITSINEKIRKSFEYKLWRESVYKRDGYTCVFCGKKGDQLNADHIKPFAYYPELRFAIDNGRTLCVPCHRTTDTWGNRNLKSNK